jgi:hypothetical protein
VEALVAAAAVALELVVEPEAYVSVRQHTSAYVSIRQALVAAAAVARELVVEPEAYVSVRQHTSAYVSIRQHTSGAGSGGGGC